MEYKIHSQLNAHDAMKRSRDARRVVKHFVWACESLGVRLKAKDMNIDFGSTLIHFFEQGTDIRVGLQMSTYDVKGGTNYALELFTPQAPDGSYGPSGSAKKRGALDVCVQHVALVAQHEMPMAYRCYLERLAASEKLRTAGGVQCGLIHFNFNNCSASIQPSGKVRIQFLQNFPVDEALPFLLQSLRGAA